VRLVSALKGFTLHEENGSRPLVASAPIAGERERDETREYYQHDRALQRVSDILESALMNRD